MSLTEFARWDKPCINISREGTTGTWVQFMLGSLVKCSFALGTETRKHWPLLI